MAPLETREDDLVRCMACGCTYALPAAGAAVDQPVGCPRCGALSWVALRLPHRPPLQGARRR